jgi:nicotinate-nucleotide adenylyltransferase
MKIAILLGAFDPVTNGHIQLANFVSKHFDKVWIVPSFKHAYDKKTVSFDDRLNMLNLAIEKYPKLVVSDFEREFKPDHGRTYELVKELLYSRYAKGNEFSIVIGQDNAEDIFNWYNHKSLLSMMSFTVVTRKGVLVNKNTDWYLKQPHLYLKDDCDEIMEISSTTVRGLLRDPIKRFDKGLLSNYINEDVYDYIIENELYV